MSGYVDFLLTRDRGASVAIDTNLLLLHVIGSYDLAKLGKFRATRKYNEASFALLKRVVDRAGTVLISTHVLTETDNLVRQVEKSEWPPVAEAMRRLVGVSAERHFAGSDLLAMDEYPLFGISDCSLIELSAQGAVVVTDDLRLTAAIERSRRPVLNLSRLLWGGR